MPGKRITDHQVHQYKQDRNRMTQVPDLHALSELLAPPRTTVPEVTVQIAALSSYDALIEVSQ